MGTFLWLSVINADYTPGSRGIVNPCPNGAEARDILLGSPVKQVARL